MVYICICIRCLFTCIKRSSHQLTCRPASPPPSIQLYFRFSIRMRFCVSFFFLVLVSLRAIYSIFNYLNGFHFGPTHNSNLHLEGEREIGRRVAPVSSPAPGHASKCHWVAQKLKMSEQIDNRNNTSHSSSSSSRNSNQNWLFLIASENLNWDMKLNNSK